MNFFKKPGRILLTIMIVLIADMPYAASDLHPYSAYLMAIPYMIIEVTLGSLYYVRTRDS